MVKKNCDISLSNSSQAVRRDLLTSEDEETIVSSVRELVKAYNSTRKAQTEKGREAVCQWEQLDDDEIDNIITNLFALNR